MNRTNGSIVITHTGIVSILEKYRYNEALMDTCSTVLFNILKNLDSFMETYTLQDQHSKEKSDILQHILAIEKNIESQLGSITEDIIGKVDNHFGKLIMSISDIMTNSVKQLNVSSLKEYIRDCFENGNKTGLIELENKLRCSILDPMNESQKRLVDHIVKLPEQVIDSISKENISKKLDDINDKWGNNINTVIQTVKDIEHEVDCLIKFHDNDKEYIKNIPINTKLVFSDMLRDLDKQSEKVATIVNTIQHEMRDYNCSITHIKSTTADLKTKLESLDKQLLTKHVKESNSNIFKGGYAEDKLYQLLNERLMHRDGYRISQVNGQAHNCDILIKRDSYPDIRIESKAHGQATGEKVRTKDVEKFQRDLTELNNHGIFISLYSGIVGKGEFEIEQLPNGKFAIYLSNNNYNIDIITDMIHLLYRLDSIITNAMGNDSENMFTMSSETMSRLQMIIKDFNAKLNTVKAHMKESIALLNELTLDIIEKTIIKQTSIPTEPEKVKTIVSEFKCDNCGKDWASKRALAKHKSICSVSKEI